MVNKNKKRKKKERQITTASLGPLWKERTSIGFSLFSFVQHTTIKLGLRILEDSITNPGRYVEIIYADLMHKPTICDYAHQTVLVCKIFSE